MIRCHIFKLIVKVKIYIEHNIFKCLEHELYNIILPVIYKISKASILIFFPEKPQCWIDFPHKWQWRLYMTLITLTLLVLPALIISACYTIIVITIWSKSKVLIPSRHLKSK